MNSHIAELYRDGQRRAHQAVNSLLSESYCRSGCDIVEFEQGGTSRAAYG